MVSHHDDGYRRGRRYSTSPTSSWPWRQGHQPGAGVGPTGVSQNPFNFDNTTYGVYFTKYLREAILESNQTNAVELESLQAVDQWLPGDSFGTASTIQRPKRFGLTRRGNRREARHQVQRSLDERTASQCIGILKASTWVARLSAMTVIQDEILPAAVRT